MKRTEYKGYIIDTDNLGRAYIHNTDSPYSEESDKELLTGEYKLKEIKAIIDQEIEEKIMQINVKKMRTEKGMTQQQLADESGVNIRQIQKVEKGEILFENMTYKNAMAILSVLQGDQK